MQTAPTPILDLPTDESQTLRPTRILYIVRDMNWAHTTIPILDLTAQLQESYDNDFTPEFHVSAKSLAKAASPPPPYLTLTRNHWYSNSRITVTDAAGLQVAEWHSPTLAYGTTRITFPETSPHCSHELTVTRVSSLQRAQSFVKDSVTYAWEGRERFKPGRLSLFKSIAGTKKLEVGRYESDTGGFAAGGPLVLETREVDDLVALLTCMAVLNQSDSFVMP